jgi:hypothetical protein
LTVGKVWRERRQHGDPVGESRRHSVRQGINEQVVGQPRRQRHHRVDPAGHVLDVPDDTEHSGQR